MTAQQNRDDHFQAAALTLLLERKTYTQSELAVAVNAVLAEQEDKNWRKAISSPDGIARVFRGALKALLATKNEMRLARAERVVSCLEDDDYVKVSTVRPETGGVRYEYSLAPRGYSRMADLTSVYIREIVERPTSARSWPVLEQ